MFCATDSQGVEIEIKESDCKGPKPATYGECGTQPCPAEWYTVRAGAVSQITQHNSNFPIKPGSKQDNISVLKYNKFI